jgi:hypothetical protein
VFEVSEGHVAQAGVFVVADVIFGVCALALAALEDLDVRVGLVSQRGLKAMTVVVGEAQLRAGTTSARTMPRRLWNFAVTVRG